MNIPHNAKITVWMLLEQAAELDSRVTRRVAALYTHKTQAEAALRGARSRLPSTLWYLRELDTQPHGEGQPEFGERMSPVKDTSQPAFPLPASYNANGETLNYPEYGMSLRDYFAAKALQGLLASETQASPDVFAAAAYQAADAMLKARAK